MTAKPVLPALTVTIAGEVLAVSLHRHPQARRLTLRLDARTGLPRITAPPTTPEHDIRRFLDSHQNWIATRLLHTPPAPALADGLSLMLQGQRLTLQLDPTAPRRVRASGDRLIVGGPADMAAPRLARFYQAQARQALEPAVAAYAAMLEVRPRGLKLRDTVSRWGSCSAAGMLNFNWRLAMAPPDILHYVAAHEVAHLSEANHSPAFWRLVARCRPDWRLEDRWLKGPEAAALMRVPIGASARPAAG